MYLALSIVPQYQRLASHNTSYLLSGHFTNETILLCAHWMNWAHTYPPFQYLVTFLYLHLVPPLTMLIPSDTHWYLSFSSILKLINLFFSAFVTMTAILNSFPFSFARIILIAASTYKYISSCLYLILI